MYRAIPGCEATHEFKLEASWLHWVPCDPDILKVCQSKLISVVLSMEREHAVVHQGNGPEFGYGLEHMATFFVHRNQLALSFTL